jgi:hypothetical protein
MPIIDHNIFTKLSENWSTTPETVIITLTPVNELPVFHAVTTEVVVMVWDRVAGGVIVDGGGYRGSILLICFGP